MITPSHILYFLRAYLKRGRIIRLNPEGYETETRIIAFDDFAFYCYMPKDYDPTEDNYNQQAKFFGHIEVEKEFHVCFN